MKTVTYSRYYLKNPNPRGKPYISGWEMSPEDATARGLTEADRVPGTSVQREIPETEAETSKAMAHYQSAGFDSVKPPRRSDESTD